MFRNNASQAQSMMVKCKDCLDVMNAVYSDKCRNLCWSCGGEIKFSEEMYGRENKK